MPASPAPSTSWSRPHRALPSNAAINNIFTGVKIKQIMAEKTQAHKFFQIECDLPALKTHLYSAGGGSSVSFTDSGTGLCLELGLGQVQPWLWLWDRQGRSHLNSRDSPGLSKWLHPLPAAFQRCVICFSSLSLQQTGAIPTPTCFLSLLE